MVSTYIVCKSDITIFMNLYKQKAQVHPIHLLRKLLPMNPKMFDTVYVSECFIK
jgi:hypothetical protein